MLQTLHKYKGEGVAIYGMNRGSVGFLMNEYNPDDLPARVAATEPMTLNPLKMRATPIDAKCHEAPAITEASLLQQTLPAATIRIKIAHLLRDQNRVLLGKGS